jgi:cytidylate kinase
MVFDSEKIAYRNITVSGKIATGTSTLAMNLKRELGWEYINTGELQRRWDREHGINENARGAVLRSDDHEREMEEMAKETLSHKSQVVFEAWLSGFIAREMRDVFKVLVVCSDDAVRIDRVLNRENVTVKQAKNYIQTREKENVKKWKKLYGDYDFWDPKYYDLMIDTYVCGPMETLGKVMDALVKKRR